MRPSPAPPGAAAAALLLAFAALAALSLPRRSLTFDEIIYPAAGHDYWRTGRVRVNPEHPPLAKALSALPLLALPLEPPLPSPSNDASGFLAGWRYFFRNTVPAPRLALLCRLPSLLAGLGAGLFLFLWARRRHGPGAAALALAFLLADPSLRAASTLAVGDIFLVCFLTGALLYLERYLDEGFSARTGLLAGLLAGAAVLSKFSGLLFFPIAVLSALAREDRRDAAKALLLPYATASLLVLVAYASDLRPLAFGLRYQAFHLDAPGEFGSAPWPLLFLMKTPFPFQIASALGLWAWARQKDRRAASAASALICLAAAASATRHPALRYGLPLFPLLALGIAAAWAWAPRLRPVLAALLLWQAAESARAYPHELAYANAPWRARALRLFSNSDLDWGQDLPALEAYWRKEGRPPLSLCYFGTAEPEAWGIEAQRLETVPGLPSSDFVLPASPSRELLAVSAGCRQYMRLSAPQGPSLPAWEWLDSRRPLAVLGSTLYVYDVSRDAEAHGRLGQLHLFQGACAKARREARRVLDIAPRDALGARFLRAVEARCARAAPPRPLDRPSQNVSN